MGTYVLIHGAWHGGWCWRQVADELRSAGHTVITPTLTGLAERSDELTRQVGLDTHVDDVVAAVNSAAGNQDVILVGHSYAGMVVTGAAARLSDRIGMLVVVDGFLPGRGETALELLPERAAAHYRESAAERGDGWRVPPRPPANLGVTDERLITELPGRLTDHPFRTYTDPSRYGARELTVPGTYLLCSGWATPFRPMARRAGALGWSVGELDADHEIPVTAPGLLANRLATVESAEEASA